ncbi:MAG: transglutaminase domain-containing protein [Allosphingosinicella sp.]|uniref:transglutaminase family protein n=1 Tax=Allosphingosinicella sp. TaxID=2823234 RepID=UPI003948AD39
MQLSIRYTTTYHYPEPAARLVQLLRVTPHSFAGQTVLDWRIDVDSDARLREHRDGYGNIVHMLYMDRPPGGLEVRVTGRVLTEDRAGVIGEVPFDLPREVFLRPTELTGVGGPLEPLVHALRKHDSDDREILHHLNERLFLRMRFDAEATGLDTSADEAFEAGHGVCQDFAHIFIAVSRALGIPARYVSGHLYRRDGEHRQPATHAWAEAWDRDLGWIGFDPTHGISTDDAYVRVACGLDYRDAAPFSGRVAGGGDQRLEVDVEVKEVGRRRQQQRQSQS